MTMARPTFALLALGIALVLAGCGDRPREMNLREVRSAGDGPEEFGIVPNRPLEFPTDLADLPEPTPNGENRTAQRPLDDAVIALGGAPSRTRPTGAAPTGDAALIAQSSRFGREAEIRSTLAEEDLAFREQRSLFSWQLAPSDRYNRAYEPQRLDPHSEAVRFRRAGVRTPAAPPRGVTP